MKKLNEVAIPYKGDKLFFYKAAYVDGTMGVACETEYGEPYATISVNLSSYGMKFNDNELVLHHDLPSALVDIFIKSFCKDSNYRPIIYGMATSEIVTLKDEYID